jgi:thiamine-phosphate pyrophosphorylase
MPLKLQKPVIYLITSGKSTAATTPASRDFSQIIGLVEAAVAAKVDLLQLREKNLSARVLYELTVRAANVTNGTSTRLLVNDRADIARSARADGVHLTTSSIQAAVVRKTFGVDFLIGVSTHSVAEASVACSEGADFAVFGPVFATASKERYGEPVGLESLAEVVAKVSPFPILALGGIGLDRVSDCFRAGAAGIAGIRIFEDSSKLSSVLNRIREIFLVQERDG